jgi:hypothetical protein
MEDLKKIDRDINVQRADNGYIVEFSYRDQEDDYKRAKRIFESLDNVIAFLKIAEEFPLDD